MPIYAYRCSACGHAQDVLQKISAPVLTICPACGQATYTKQVTAAGFQLKGSGWYVTDFRDGHKGAPAKDKAGDATESAAGDKAVDKPAENAAGKAADQPAGKAAEKADAPVGTGKTPAAAAAKPAADKPAAKPPASPPAGG